MANLSYCRMQNTLKDLRDVKENFDEVESLEEAEARLKIFQLCQYIAESYDGADLAERIKELEDDDNET